MRSSKPKPGKLDGVEVVVFSTEKVTWETIKARGLYTKTQAAKLGLTLEDKPAAQYFMAGWKYLYKLMPASSVA
jgi:hypothetical protein